MQREKAATARVRIEQFIREIEGQVSWASHSSFMPEGQSAEQRRFDFLWLLRQVPSVTEVSYLDSSGKEQLRVSRLARDEIGSQKDYSQEAKFREAMTGKTYFGPVYFRKESEPYMTLAVKWRGPTAGVTVAELNLKFIWEVVSQLTVGPRGYAYVVNSQGVLVAHPDISLVLQKTDLSSLPQVRAVLVAKGTADPPAAEVEIGDDLRGGSVLTAHAAIAPLGWWVFVEQPVREAFAPAFAALIRIGGAVGPRQPGLGEAHGPAHPRVAGRRRRDRRRQPRSADRRPNRRRAGGARPAVQQHGGPASRVLREPGGKG
jgi:hypothetical protein